MSSRNRSGPVPKTRKTTRRPKPATTPSLSAIPAMSTQALRLLLDRYHLVSTGRKELLVKRLVDHLQADTHSEGDRRGSHSESEPDPDDNRDDDDGDDDRVHSSADDRDQPLEYHAEESDFSNADEQQSPPSRGRRHAEHASRQERHSLGRSRRSRHRHQRPRYSHHRHAAPLRRSGKESRSHRSHPREAGHRSRSDREDPHSRWPDTSSSEEYRPRHRRCSSSSSSSSSSSPSASLSSSSTSTSSDSGRGRHHCHRRQHYPRHRHSSCYHSHTSAAAVVSCSPPLPHHVQRKIKRGEYVNFDRLLPSADSPPFAHTRRHRHRKATNLRTVTDLASWLETWNRYLCVAIAYDPSRSLELAKYQTIVCMLFTHYPPQAGVAYDQHIRQQAAIRPATRWDCLKEDIFMWALHPSRTVTYPTPANIPSARDNPQPFRDGRPPAVRPPRPFQSTEPHVSHDATGAEICRRYNVGKCTRDDQCKFSHRCWVPGCNGAHPAKGCPKRPW